MTSAESYHTLSDHVVNASTKGQRSRAASITDEPEFIHDLTLTEGPTASAAVGGGKTIGLLGGVALLLNNVTGGGMVLFPQLYQQGGWLLCTLVLLILMALTALTSFMLMETMAMMKNNNRFQRRVEYTTIAAYYCTPFWYWIVMIFYQLCLTANNISTIVQSIQVMDFTVVALLGSTCAVPQLYPNPAFITCPLPVDGNISPFDPTAVVFSFGWWVTAAVTVPFALVNLDDNMYMQIVAFFAVLGIVFCWAIIFIVNGVTWSYVPAVGANISNIVGVSIFNFAFITSIPSWVNEKKPETSIATTLFISLPLCVVLFVIIGWLGGLSFVPWTTDETLLNKLIEISTDVPFINTLSIVTFYIFPAVVNLTSISVFSIFQRYNLLEQKICGPFAANMYAIVLPWVVAALLETGDGFAELVNWSGVFLNSAVNFIIPPLLYIVAIYYHRQQALEAEDDHQRADGGEDAGHVSIQHIEHQASNGHITDTSAPLDVVVDDDLLPQWKWLPLYAEPYRLHMSAAILLIMGTLVGLAIEQTIQQIIQSYSS